MRRARRGPSAGREARGLGELRRRLLRLTEPAERLAQLVVDRLELRICGLLPHGELECSPERGHGLGGLLEGQLAAAEMVDERAAGLDPDGRFEQGEGLRRTDRVEQGEAQLVVRQGILGRELQLLAELRLGLRQLASAPLRVRQGHHPQVVVRSAHAGVLLEGLFQLRARSLVLAGVAVGTADEHTGLRDRAGLHDLGEQAVGGVDPLEPQVLARQQEHHLRVVGPRRRRLVQPLRRLIGLPGCEERPREQAPGLHVARVPSGERRQDRNGRGRLARLQEPAGQGLHPVAAPGRERERLAVRVPRLGQAVIEPLERPHQEPALEQGLAVVGFGSRELPLLQARLGRRDRPLESESGILPHLGGGPRHEEEAQREAGGSTANARTVRQFRH